MPHSPGATLSRSQRYAACIRRPRPPLPLTLARRRQAETAEKGGFAEKYTQKILDNIQVTIQDIHIRYEDAVSSQRAAWVDDAASVFGAGLTVDSIQLKSFLVDLKSGRWEERFVEEQQRYLNKMLKLGQTSPGAAGGGGEVRQSGVAVYINQGEQPYDDPGSRAWRERMWNAIARDGLAVPDMQYAFGPMSMEVQVSIDKEPAKSPQ